MAFSVAFDESSFRLFYRFRLDFLLQLTRQRSCWKALRSKVKIFVARKKSRATTTTSLRPSLEETPRSAAVIARVMITRSRRDSVERGRIQISMKVYFLKGNRMSSAIRTCQVILRSLSLSLLYNCRSTCRNDLNLLKHDRHRTSRASPASYKRNVLDARVRAASRGHDRPA